MRQRLAILARLALCAVALLFCVATPAQPPPPPRPFPAWSVAEGSETTVGCAVARAWVAKSGKRGVGVVLRLSNLDAAAECAASLRDASFTVTGLTAAAPVVAEVYGADARTVAGGDVTAITLAPCDARFVYLGFELDNERAWNRGQRQGELRLSLAAGDAATDWRLPATHRWVQLPAPHWGHQPDAEAKERRCEPPR